jgi:hypothetical protein
MIIKRPPGEIGQPANSSDTDWQIAGQLELPSCVDAHSMINAWLPEVLTPLQLNAVFLNRVLKSAQDSAARAMRSEMVMKNQHPHLLIYIPAGCPVNGRTWGFFRIDKVEPVADNENSRAHSIELYLYLEGQ